MRPEDFPYNKERIGANGEAIKGPSVIALGSGDFVVAAVGNVNPAGVRPLHVFGDHGRELSLITSYLQKKVTIGRADSNNVVSPIRSVSFRHAEITREQNEWRVSDIGSLNGTFMEEIEVIPADGEVVHIPRGEVRFIPSLDSEDVDVDIQLGSVNGKLVEHEGDKFLTVNGKNYPLILNMPHHVGRSKIQSSEKDIDRGKKRNNIIIVDESIDDSHVILIPLSEGVIILDQDSREGTRVKVTPHDTVESRDVFTVDKHEIATMDEESARWWKELGK